MKKLFYPLCLTTVLSQYSFSQIVGGRDNGEMAPKSVESSKLNPGGVVSDVNTFTGEYTSAITLGSVNTPGGLSYSLSLNYSSNASVGTTAPVSSGIPYGEGWSLDVPTLSVEADVFHKYLLDVEDKQQEMCGSTASSPNSFVTNYDGPASVNNDPIDKYTGLDHGDPYWFAPQLSIPGVVSGRLIFKYLDASVSPNQLVFGLHGFESPVEVRMINTKIGNVTTSKWTVTLSDGTVYLFDLVQQSFNSPMNTRVLNYDKCTSTGGNAAAAVNTGTYSFNGNQLEANVLNSILPRFASAVWYCTRITSNTVENQQIDLEYDKYGKFNFYNEFSPVNLQNQSSTSGINNFVSSNNLIGDFTTYRDVLLKKVVAKVENYPFEIMELDYQTLMSAITSNPNILIDYTAANSGQLDDLYSWKSVYQKGGSTSSFSGWSRYNHIKAANSLSELNTVSGTTYNITSTNPYISSSAPGGLAYRRTTGVSGAIIDFADGFLESERISASSVKMIPGDVYEVRTKINNTRGTVDVAIVSGDLGNTPASGAGSFSTYNTQSGSWYPVSNYNISRGIELFSTFNSAFKWWKPLQQSSQNPYNNELRTSNFFVMPNVPSAYQGFNIQVGPGSSDVDYATPPEALWQYLASGQISAQSWRAKEAYSFMPLSLTSSSNPVDFLYKSGANLPHNFGTGLPWGMMVPMYQGMDPYIPTHEKSMFQCWYMNSYVVGQNPGGGIDKHRPTTMGYQDPARYEMAELEEVELIRYTKNPYMLRGVRIYRVNNGNETTGKQIIAQKQLDYSTTLKPLIENYDYYNYQAGSTPIKSDATRNRIVFLLQKVHELPLNATLYSSNFGLASTTEAGQVLTTAFEYTDVNTSSASSIIEIRGEKIHALTSVVDHLGGITTITYQPLSNSNFTSTYDPEESNNAVINGYSTYGKGVLFKATVIVNSVSKTSDAGTQLWTYSFSNPVIKHNQYLLHNNHFRNEFTQSITRGFKNATISLPLINGITARTEIEYFGDPLETNITLTQQYTMLNVLCFGKVKSTKSYMNNVLNSEQTNTYSNTLAFENGAIRPSFKRTNTAYNADMSSTYLYEDYYLNQTNFNSLTEPSGKTEWMTYYNSYNPVAFQGEQPKMMEALLYDDLLSANQNYTWLFNSYFVKLTTTISRQYEDGEYKMPLASASPCYDINGNIIACPVIVIEPGSCSSTLSNVRRYIETKTDFTYYEADQTGKAQGTAYHLLFGINVSNPPTINFANYGMGSGSKSQAIVLLKHEPSWQLASSTVTSPQIGTATKKENYFYYYDLNNRYDRHWYLYDLVTNPLFSIQVFNGDTIAVNNIVSNVKRANAYSLPRYEGMESSRVHHLRSLTFQKMTTSKNASDKAISKSEYYHFDNSWTYATTQTYKPVLLRYGAVQIDSLTSTNGNYDFRMGRIDRGNIYIADFRAVTASVQSDGKDYIYSMLSPYDRLITKTISERNRLLMPLTIENQLGIKTRYNINTTNSSGVFNNLGLVESIIVGYSRTDAMTSSFQYNLQGLLKKLTEPSARYVEYLYDDYLRLKQTTENGNRILSNMTYNVWNKTAADNFYQRTGKNYILTEVFNSATTNDKEILKSFIDPLGRDHSTLQAYYDLANTLVVTKSPTKVYDSWNRVTQTYKSYSGTDLNIQNNVTTPFAQVQYENQLAGRIIKSADFGEDISNSSHTVNNASKLVNGVIAYCELGLNNAEAKVMMLSTGSGGAFYFLRQTTTDQDGKQTVTYMNAFGQLAAKMTYTSVGVKAVTIFGYDSYGNLNKVINPNDQITTYLYNILGQLVMETSVDGGTKRYMYNKLGMVSVEQDQYERTRTVSGSLIPRYRVYKYDDYGKLTGVGLMNLSLYGGQLYDPLYYANANNSSFNYTFTNASTYDWLCSYWLNNKFNQMVLTSVTPSTFAISQWEKSFTYGVTIGQNTIGKIIQENSFNNTGVKIQKHVYTYDAVGNIATQLTTFSPVNADGTVNITTSKIEYPSYNYRRALLEEKVDVNNDNVTDLHLFFGYDRLGRPIEISAALGSVVASTDATLLVTYTYDIDGKITKKEHRIDDSTPLNRLAMEIAYSYDTRDRLTQIDAKNGTLSVAKYSLFYDAQNPVSGTNTVTAHQNWNGNINGALMEYNFSTATNAVSNFNGTSLFGYQYDQMNRLTKADAAIGDFIAQNAVQGALIGDEEITLDKIGNILSLKRGLKGSGANFTETEWWNYTYQSGTNKLNGVTGQNAYSVNRSYIYDANGNLLSDSYRQITTTSPIQYGRAAYAYRIAKGTDVIDYLYDTEDQRVYKKVDAVDNNQDLETYYLQDFMGKTVAIREIQLSGTTWEYFVNGTEREMSIKPTAAQAPGANAANANKRVGMTQTVAFVYDHLGNTRVAYSSQSWNSTNNLINYNVESVTDYAPFGKVMREFVNVVPSRYLTAQHERDAETGLDYRGARYYDSDIARFLSVDPLAAKFPDWSPYAFCNDNPLRFVDPDGREAKDWIKKVDSDKWEYHSGVQSQAGATARFGEGTEYMDDGGTYQGKQGGKDLGTVTVHTGGLQTWGGGSYQSKDINPFPILSTNLLPNPFIQNNGNNSFQQAGIEPNKHWVGPALIGLGSQTILKPFSLGKQATKGTSVASTVLREVFPYRSPAIKKVTTVVLGRASSTAVLGGALGRAVPVVGWLWTGVDIMVFGLKNGEYTDFKSNTEISNPNIIVGPKW
jgi:RHS repeat-associated protein